MTVMENTAFEGEVEKRSMELTDVKVNNGQGHKCEPEACRALHAQYIQGNTKMTANPWDRLKTVFLVGIIGILALWLVVYVASSRMGLL